MSVIFMMDGSSLKPNCKNKHEPTTKLNKTKEQSCVENMDRKITL